MNNIGGGTISILRWVTFFCGLTLAGFGGSASIYRDGVWWMLKSGSGAEAVQFGFGSDVPIQAAFVR